MQIWEAMDLAFVRTPDSVPRMLQGIRFAGLLIVAVWLGATVFLTFGAGPAFFSPAMLEIMPRYHAGRAAQIVLSAFFEFQIVCSWLAALLVFVDWAVTGRLPRKWALALLGVLLGLVLLGGTVAQPRLRRLHAIMYAPNTSVAEKETAAGQFRRWHGVSQAGNLVVLLGVIVYFWSLTTPPATRPGLKYPGRMG